MEIVVTPGEVLAYCAGVIDSDGCIRIKNHFNSYGPYISCRQVALEAVTLLKECFGGGIYRTHPPKGSNLRVQNGWAVTHKGAARCALALLPYLRIKHRQAEIAIEVADLCGWKTGLKLARIAEQQALFCEAGAWLTLQDVARMTGRPITGLYQATRSGRLASRKVGHRVMVADSCIDAFCAPTVHHRPAEISGRLATLWREARDLNQVGVPVLAATGEPHDFGDPLPTPA